MIHTAERKKKKKSKYRFPDSEKISDNNKVAEPSTVYAIQQPTAHYKEDVYTKIAVQDLMTYGVYSIYQNKETCTFERLVAECFFLFPKVFGLKRYPHWPDTLKFDRATRSLRERGLITGGIGGKQSPGEFRLTEFGVTIAKNIEKTMKNKEATSTLKVKSSHSIRSIDDKLIEYLKQSPYYKRFTENPDTFTITEPEFRNMLRCTLETSWRVVKQNLEYFKQLANSYNEKKVIDFLYSLENKFFSKINNYAVFR